MPINGRNTNKFPIIVTVHCGAPKPEKGAGRNLDYFRVELANVAIADERMMQVVNDVLGVNPVEVRFKGVTPDVDGMYSEWLESRNQLGTMMVRCDGEVIHTWTDERYVKHHDKKPCQRGKGDGSKESGCQCRPKGYLIGYIPELEAATGRFGYVMMLIGGWYGTKNVKASLDLAYQRYGGLLNVPFVLYRQSQAITYNAGATSKTNTQSIVQLRVAEDYVQHRAALAAANPTTGELPMPQAPIEVQLPTGTQPVSEPDVNWRDEIDYYTEVVADSYFPDTDMPKKDAVDELITDNAIWYADKVTITRQPGDKKPTITIKFGSLLTYTCNTRKQFIEAGVIGSDDWIALGEYQLSPRFAMTFERDSNGQLVPDEIELDIQE